MNYTEEKVYQILILLIVLLLGVLSLVRNSRIVKCKGSKYCDSVNSVKSCSINNLKGLARQQRHDFMNFFQVIYGYLQLNKKDKAIDQIKKITKMSSNLSKVFKLSIPSISFLLSKKINDANNYDISLVYQVKSEIPDELRDIENEEEIMTTLNGIFDSVIGFFENIDGHNSLKINIEEYKNKIKVVFYGKELKYVFEKLKIQYKNININGFEYYISFELKNIRNLKVEDNIYSKVLFN